MQKTLGWLVMAGIVAVSVGCSNSQTISRGQSPTLRQLGYDQPAGAYCPPGCPPGCPEAAGRMMAPFAPRWGGPQGPGQTAGKPPREYERRFQPPTGLRYPPQNVPPTVVQYPYYTLRGPTDFFYE